MWELTDENESICLLPGLWYAKPEVSQPFDWICSVQIHLGLFVVVLFPCALVEKGNGRMQGEWREVALLFILVGWPMFALRTESYVNLQKRCL